MFNRKESVNKSYKGFTLIEVLVAISIIITVLFVPIAIITEYIAESALTENNAKANILAKEVIEYVRYDRDSNLLVNSNWFISLRERDNTSNDYRRCVLHEENWVRGDRRSACLVECTEDTTTSNCNGRNGFVSGFSTSQNTIGTVDGTCDGNAATEDFKVTLTVLIPSDENAIQYAAIKPCISWKEKNGVVKKVEITETLFHWLVR